MSLANGNLTMMKVDDATAFESDFVTELPATPLKVFEQTELRRAQLTPRAFEEWRELMLKHHLGVTTSEGWEPFEL